MLQYPAGDCGTGSHWRSPASHTAPCVFFEKAQRKSRRTPSPLSGRNNSQQKLPDSSATSCIFAYASFFSINDDKIICNTFLIYFVCFLRFFEDTIQWFQALEDSFHSHCAARTFLRAQDPLSAENQTIRSYSVNYNDSYTRFWDGYTDAYQKSKKIQH